MLKWLLCEERTKMSLRDSKTLTFEFLFFLFALSISVSLLNFTPLHPFLNIINIMLYIILYNIIYYNTGLQISQRFIEYCGQIPHTYWLAFQEVNVVKDIPLSGSEIVQPILNDSLAFLKNNPQEDCKQTLKLT